MSRRPEAKEGCRLYVGGLSDRCDVEDLKSHFGKMGTVVDGWYIYIAFIFHIYL